MSQKYEDGIYFGMPDEEYQEIGRLSGSLIKVIVRSPLEFWFASWMNPEREPDADSAAKKLGRAYHKLILEGDEAFNAAYAVAPSRDDYPDAIDGADALRAKLGELGLKRSGSIAEMCERIREADPDTELWPDIVGEFNKRAADRETLAATQWREMQRVRLVLNRMPGVKTGFTAGFPEVTILFHFRGVAMKARLDYLKPRGARAGILDLKTFSNRFKKPIENVPATEIAGNEYFIQPYVYDLARRTAGETWRAEGDRVIHVVSGAAPDLEWLAGALLPEKADFHFVFAQTGGVPDIIVRGFSEGRPFGGLGFQANEYWLKGKILTENGIDRFKECMATYGSDVPWVIDHGIRDLTDMDFRDWQLEYHTELRSDSIDDLKDAA